MSFVPSDTRAECPGGVSAQPGTRPTVARTEPLLIAPLDRRMERRPAGLIGDALHQLLATSLFGDVAAALREHGSATLDEHCCYFRRPDCVTVRRLNLEAGLLFFDTTSTYFETEHADEALPRDQNGRRAEAG